MIAVRQLAAVMLLLIPIASVRADTTHTSTQETQLEQTPLAVSERARAEFWGLTETEWQRYRSLLQGIRGSVSPATLSPLEVLGIHARDDAERTRYAEQWAMAMRDDAERILAFQHAYDEANRRLFPDAALIDPSQLPARAPTERDLQATDRVLVFVRPACPACETLLTRVLALRDKVAGIDIFVADIARGDEGAVRAWANAQHIEPAWVRSRQVTVNFAVGSNRPAADIPYLMRRRGDALTPLATTVF